MLGLGVAATITANVAYGAVYGLTGAVISAWPAGGIRWFRRAAHGDHPAHAAGTCSGTAAGGCIW